MCVGAQRKKSSTERSTVCTRGNEKIQQVDFLKRSHWRSRTENYVEETLLFSRDAEHETIPCVLAAGTRGAFHTCSGGRLGISAKTLYLETMDCAFSPGGNTQIFACEDAIAVLFRCELLRKSRSTGQHLGTEDPADVPGETTHAR